MKPVDDQSFFVRFEDGHAEPYDVREVVGCVARELDPVERLFPPWIIEMATECLIRHFGEIAGRRQVLLAEFIGTARELLQGFMTEMAHRDLRERQLDLSVTARQPGFGFELEFFNRVKEFLRKVGKDTAPFRPTEVPVETPLVGFMAMDSRKRVLTIRVTGLGECVKFLMGQRHWSWRCEQLRDEIVAFIRREAGRSGQDLLIAVVS